MSANRLHFAPVDVKNIISAAAKNAREAQERSFGKQEKFVALDIGSLGRLLKPFGDYDFEDAVSVFGEMVQIGAKCGVDLICIETMNDLYETKAALLAAKENCDLPVFVTNAYGSDGKLLTGADPAAVVATLEGMGADAVGVNCSFGPLQLADVVRQYLKYASVPVIFKPNAGIPRDVDEKTVFDVSPKEFSEAVSSLVREGVRAVGGCCGTTPEYLSLLVRAVAGLPLSPIEKKRFTCVSSGTHAVFFSDHPLLIGERINPTGKKRFQQALAERDMDYILSEGLKQQDAGVHILDVNVGFPEIDETEMLSSVVSELQAVCDLPLQIDTSSPSAMEAALRKYQGKALINSVNGKKESMDAVFSLMKKYGGVAVALTLDENGIPTTAEGRVEIAKKILHRAEEFGIDRSNIVFDTLTMTVSADPSAANVTLEALKRIREELGAYTVLGVSNVSFGLPERGTINSIFFAMALQNGLSGAIMNPFSSEMMKTYYSYRALKGFDEQFEDYISFAASLAPEQALTKKESGKQQETVTLASAILQGRKEAAEQLTKASLDQNRDALQIINEEIIPALDEVGRAYEVKKLYLPQLLISAEAAKASFECIKMKSIGKPSVSKCTVVLATVKGDIHDIGKNIVKLLLENYGFDVCDLGKDVPPDAILQAVSEKRAEICGLSALMTTTVPAMKETVELLHKNAPWCKVVVGGAVLTEEYASSISADHFSKDAMQTVRYAESVWNDRNS